MRTRTYGRWLLAAALGLPLGTGAFGSGETSESQALLSRAFSLTARGDFRGADAAYRELLRIDPNEGFPAMARFFSRTGQTTAAAELLHSPGFSELPDLVRARTMVHAGQRRQAVKLLKKGSDATTGSLYARTLLLVNQLEALGEKSQAATELENALGSTRIADSERHDLFVALLRIAGPDHLSNTLPGLVESAVTSSTIPYMQVRTMAMDGLTVLSQGSNYADFHAALEDTATSSAVKTWLLSLSYLNRGNDVRAFEVLDQLATATLTRREKALVIEEQARLSLQDTERAITLYKQLLGLTDKPEPIRLKLAQLHFREKNFNEVTPLLKSIDLENLDEEDRQTAMNLYLTSLGASGAVSELPQEFLRMTRGLPYTKVRDLSSAPFLMFPADQVESLRRRLHEETRTTSGSQNLYVLLMALEGQINDTNAVATALQAYCKQNPDDVNAAGELADALAAIAWKTASENPETSPPLQKLEAVADAASKALWDIIRMRPYAPEPYGKLMQLYKLYNQPEKARKVPLFLSDRPNATADEIHLAAYIYATEGDAELALPLYRRAIVLKNDPRFRVNYAAALGRTGNSDEALAIYKDLVKNGVNGQQYHVGDLHANALKLARSSGREQQYLNFLESLLNDAGVADRKSFLLEEGNVLTSAGEPQLALKFFYKFKLEFPEEDAAATDAIVKTLVRMKDFNSARRMLSEEISRTTNTAELAALRNNLAITYQVEGQIDRAVAEWLKLAEDLPTEHAATRTMLNAATSLEQSGKLNRAREILHQYLNRNTGDVTGEQIARDELARLNRLDVPTEALLDSAIHEYGPDSNR